MEVLNRKLPIGIQTFEKIRREGYLYVDKTRFVWEMVSTSTPYFLSRPRRFGKSLLVSTLEAYFLGKKDLFTGLAISEVETEWKTYPVLHLDLNAKKYETQADLIAMLNQHLEKWELIYGDEKKDRSSEERFSYIIEQAYLQTGKQVVVLVDEYDKPLLQVLTNLPLFDEYRKILKAFYGVLKSSDRYLRFIFLTGVTKFAQVSVFSDLNQLQDISMWKDYAAICGITKDELVTTFEPELKILAESEEMSYDEVVDKMTLLYDGYHFCQQAEGMFNPFSVLNALKAKAFGSYWFQTGTPTFLVELLKESDYDLRTLINGVEASASSFSEYRAEANNPIPLIYQSGYLTIKEYNKRFRNYLLQFPNDEVKYGFLNFLVPFYTPLKQDEQDFYIGKFVEELESGQVDAFLTRLKAFFAGITYELNDQTERYYQTIFYLVFKLMGQFTEAEVRSAFGRADAVVRTKDIIYVFEFKLDGDAKEALHQIDEKGYLIPYIANNRRLVKVGVSFDRNTRNIGEWLVEYKNQRFQQ